MIRVLGQRLLYPASDVIMLERALEHYKIHLEEWGERDSEEYEQIESLYNRTKTALSIIEHLDSTRDSQGV